MAGLWKACCITKTQKKIKSQLDQHYKANVVSHDPFSASSFHPCTESSWCVWLTSDGIFDL